MPIRPHQLGFALATLAAFAGVTLAADKARAEADLVINRADSIVRAGSCETGAPLASGRIAIKNQGEDTAALGVTQRFSRSMLVVYVPENIDMIDKRTEREKLDPFDQEGVEFELGNGIVKKGRFFGRPELGRQAYQSYRPITEIVGRNRTARIQRALDRIGYDPGTIDGIMGPNTRNAIRTFQRSINALATGELTEGQIDQLFEKAGVDDNDDDYSSPTYGAQGPTTVTVYAVVDPYNLIPETNEANNIWAFEIEIDCGR